MTKHSLNSGLAVIALFKLLKGVVLLLVGARLLRLVDPEIATFLAPLTDVLHLNVHSSLIQAQVLKVSGLSLHDVFLMGYVGVCYAVLLCTEGVGLWIEVSWAAYLAVISTSIVLPAEFYEVARQGSVMHVAVLLMNLTIVGYLVARLGWRTLR